jgi:hypothetical protein
VSYSEKTGDDQGRKKAWAMLTKHGASRSHALLLIKRLEELAAIVERLGNDLAEQSESYESLINEGNSHK